MFLDNLLNMTSPAERRSWSKYGYNSSENFTKQETTEVIIEFVNKEDDNLSKIKLSPGEERKLDAIKPLVLNILTKNDLIGEHFGFSKPVVTDKKIQRTDKPKIIRKGFRPSK